jgi:hypothetical protein
VADASAPCDGTAACQPAAERSEAPDQAASSSVAPDVQLSVAATAPPADPSLVETSPNRPTTVTASAPAAPVDPSLDTASRSAASTAVTASVPTIIAMATPAPTAQAAHRGIFDDGFADNQRGWPNDPRSTAWLSDGGYHLFARNAGRFVAISLPGLPSLRDVVLTAVFHKAGGPPGGGYGLIVRDQRDGARDGLNQDGHYYVLEAGDRGEIGVWRRDGDRWIDVLPWTPSPLVRPGSAPNELTAQVDGQRLRFLVNGAEAAASDDAALASGSIGVFVGGDGNQVVLEKLCAETQD